MRSWPGDRPRAPAGRRPSPAARSFRAVETVTDEVIDNPQWLIARAERADPALTVTLQAILASLRKLDERIVSADTGMAILSAAVTAVGRRLAFLNDLSGPGADVARPAITAALDAIFETVFGDGVAMDARWKLSHNSALVAVVEAGLAELARVGLEPAAFDALRDAVRAAFEDDGPFDLDAFTADLRNRLTAA